MIATLKYVRSLTEGGKNNLRTEEVTGEVIWQPREGNAFLMVSDPLTPGADGRLLRTSVIQRIVTDEPGRIVFHTRNTEYELTWTEGNA